MMNRLVPVLRTHRPVRRLATTGLALALALLMLVSPALAAPATIIDNTAGTATNDGTVNPGEYVGFTTGINNGFGNVIGSSSQLHVDSDASGNLNFGLITGGGGFNDAMVIYVDSVAGGFTSTSTFDDTADGCRRAFSGYDGSSRSILNFAPGFAADYAICLDTGFAGVWQLAGTGSHLFIASANRTTVTLNNFEMNLTMANLGLAAGGTFRYVATYLNPGNAFRSDEFQGVAQSTVPSGNPGYTTVTLASGDTNVFTSYAPVVASAGGSSAGYTTLKGAFDAINSGIHTGAVDVKINASTTETTSAVLNASGSGSASYTSVAIGPGNAGVSVSGNVAGALVDLNGADNVTIDGRVGGTGSTKDLTIDNPNTGGQALRLRGDATSNTVRYVTLKGSYYPILGTSPTSGVVEFGATVTAGTGNSNNTIEYCDITASGSNMPITAIYSVPTLAPANQNNTIQNNAIRDWYQASTLNSAAGTYGIYLGSNNTAWTISGNSLYQTAARNVTQSGWDFGAIYVVNTSGNGFVITNNTIGGSAPNAAGGPLTVTGSARFQGMRLSVGTTTATSVQGNTIRNLSIATTSGSTIHGAIILSSGSINIGTTTGNTIGSQSTTGSISFTGPSGAIFSGIVTGSGTPGVVAISNNTVGGITILGSASTNTVHFRGIFAQGAATSYTIANNTIGSATTADSVINVAAGTVFGIGLVSSSTSSSVTNNLIANLTTTNSAATNPLIGICFAPQTSVGASCSPGSSIAGAATITGNTVRTLSSSSTSTGTGSSAALIGLSQMANTTGGQTVAQNTVHTLRNIAGAAAVAIVGINYNGPSTGANSVTRNFVHSFGLSTTSTSAAIDGIYIAGGTGLTVANNMARVGIDYNGNALTTGYAINGITYFNGTANFYYNTAYVGGTGVASASNTAAFNSAVTFNTRLYKNNIWVNARSNASGAAVNAAAIIAGTLPSPTGLASDYNLFYAPGTGGALVRNGATNYATVAAWNTASGQDANSLSADPALVNPTGTAATVDLHINPSALMVEASPVSGAGTPIAGITDDFDGDLRNATTPDIGADEFTPLAVTLASFGAQGSSDRVVVSWETLSEANNAGFNLYRADDAAGPQTLLANVPSQGPGSTQGFAYTYDDLDVQPGQTYWYWLEDVSLGGATTLHGPVSATVSAPTAVTLASLQATPLAPAIPAAAAALTGLAGLMAAAGGAVNRRRAR